MHRRNKVVLFVITVALSLTSRAQQSAYHQEVFTGARPGARVHSGSGTGYHQIAWNTSGGPGACLIALDYSEDGMVWYLGSTIPIHDCTTSGTSIVAGPQNVQFVRMNMNALSNGSAVRATYTGYQTNPGGPTGTVTSVFGRTGQIQAQAGDYSVALITGAAPLFSPNFQGQPTAPTPTVGDNSNLVATTAFVTQALAGCCGGGGWNPPASPGNTIFGNNTVGTSTPSFFTPGGDISFSAGNFSVNQLHFGPNALVLTNSGIANGNCLQISGGSLIGGACGTGGGGGLSGSGGVNAIAKFTAATALGSSLLSDNGTTLTYTGSGGIVAPKVSITQGPFQLTSVEGALPALPGANNNMLVSGPDGWYVSNANSAFFKIEPPGTGGAGGAVTSVFTRTGAILAQNNDYSVSQVTGAAPLANPTFTGTAFAPAPSGAGATSPGNNQIATTAFVFANAGSGGVTSSTGTANVIPKYTGAQAIGNSLLTDGTNGTLSYAGANGIDVGSNPAANDNSTKAATTAWVKANFQASGGGGGGTAQPIGPSAQAALCQAQNSTTSNTLTISGLNILAGDTVFVGVSYYQVGGGVTTTVTDNLGFSYTSLYLRIVSSNYLDMLTSGVGLDHAANSITVTNVATSGGAAINAKFMVCIYAYVGVASIGSNTNGSGTGTANVQTTMLPTINVTSANGFMFAATTINGVTTTTAGGTGNRLQGGSTTAGSGPQTMTICDNTTTTPGSLNCSLQYTIASGTSYAWVAVELIPGVTVAPLWPGPKVVAFHKANITVTTTAATDTAFFSCSATDCPPGYYRVTWDFLSLGSGCTNGTVIVNIDYYDEYDLNTVYHTGIGSASAVGPGRNHAFWNRLQTVAKLINSTTGISFTTTTTPCSAGTGTAQQTVSVERLQ